MKENLNEKILAWLNTQGYDLEMRVAMSLSDVGFQIVQSDIYEDPETGISREIDVVGRMNDPVGFVYLNPVIECKKSSKPWVVFTTDKASFNRVHEFAIMTDAGRKAISNNIDQMLGINWFRKDGRTGYGITEAFTSKDKESFKAGMQATKAAIALLKESEQWEGNFLSFYFPTVVLDGRLFECYLGADGLPRLDEVDSAVLRFPIRLKKQIGSSVRIVTLGAFKQYCEEMVAVFDSLLQELAEDIMKISASLGMKPEIMQKVIDDNRNKRQQRTS